ncbi:NUDIX hydrolase [Wenjunlia tyrosinilytica]|jgi:8-oxo-dGTP pyrophosphatase MutT (NUDIX family)|uniref:NUDIX hydrolase n=1 Tax=Wenjunlia tyrosinilytica TaxID=1544741 RepID=A0A917ZUM6_9ACTN|nr:NUDIX domain-containing protein [Wenjunlia tyrosinilytica]GGO96096.1 NUDIX hydrolase [Wenjunlia tyrosinilytica]
MPMPDFLRELRSHVGNRLLFLPGVVAVVLDDGGRVLLGQRADNGRWALISGIAEPGEQPAQTAVREVYEETAVHAVPERLIGVYTTPVVEYPNGDRSQYLDIVFRCRAVGGQARVNDDESLEVGWFALDELPELHPRQRAALDHALTDGPAWFEAPTVPAQP